MSAISAIPKQKPISKEKVKAVLDIMDIAHAFSGQVNERPRQPLILCPFHEDKHLGSCRVYRETNTFYCESCHTAGDTLKLASGYLDIPLNQMNDLLETIVSRFGIDRSRVEVDSSARPRRKQLNLLSVEQYRFLNCGKEYVEIPVEFEPFEFENDEIEYWPTRYQKIYFRNLALKDPNEHDLTICLATRRDWLESKMYIARCYVEDRMDDCVFNRTLVKLREELLYDAVINKSAFRQEMSNRKIELKAKLAEEGLWPLPRRQEMLKGA